MSNKRKSLALNFSFSSLPTDYLASFCLVEVQAFSSDLHADPSYLITNRFFFEIALLSTDMRHLFTLCESSLLYKTLPLVVIYLAMTKALLLNTNKMNIKYATH
jgi:hypothetical protein